MGYRLGVDLGTTWTAAGAHDGTAVTAVVLGAHGPALPSVIAFDGEEVLIGETAARRLITDPTSGAREMKRRLGDTTPFVLQGTPYTAEALMGRILGHVVSVAGITFGGPPDEVVLTHPATWGEFKLDLLREAGRVAGLNEVELMAEPSAAAAHYARTGKVAADGLVGVYDFGGGTFDAAVLQGSGGRFDVVGKAEGLDRLGGIDLDQAVIAHVDQSLDGALRNLDREDPDVRQALAELRDACVAAKEALSVNSEVAIPVVVPGLSTEVRLTRAEFEAAIRPRLTETLDAFDRTVAAAGVEVAALDVVLLVGGSSRIPLVAEMLAAHTGRPMALDTDTKAAVSLGAAGWSAAAGVAGGAGAAAAVAVAAAVVGSPDTASAAPAAAGPAAGKAREKRGSATDAGTKGSPGGGRAARVAAGGAAAAAVVAAGGGAAYAASAGGATRPSLADADDADDADSDEPATTTGIDPITGESESLDAFDEVAGPAIDHPVALAGDDAGPGDRFRGGSGDGAPARAADPDDGPDRGGPTQDERVDAIQDSLRARLAAWKPPPGADPEEVADLRAELEGRIDRFDPADGVDFENAAGDLQQALDDSLEDFQQSEQLDKTEQMTGRLAQEEQREAADDAEEIEDKNGFIEYQGALSTFVQAWKPNFSPWIDGQDMVDFQKDLIGSTIGGRPFDPDRPLRGQQMALEQVVRNKLSAFEHEQYESHYRSESDRLAAAMQAEVNILNNPASSAEAKAAAASYIDTLNIQRQTIENLHNGFRDTESPPDPALDAALHAHLEPALSEMTFTEVAVDDSSRGALFALAADADGADDAEAPGGVFASVDADVSALAAEHVHALTDVFDDVATAEAAPSAVAVPTVSDESQMTGGGPPLPPGIRTMAADTSALPVDPLEDDALGVAVEAAAVRIADPAPSPVAASTFAPVGPDLGDPDDVLEPVLSSAAADLPDPISGPMADGSEDLPEDDSPNPLDDLDDPLDPSLP